MRTETVLNSSRLKLGSMLVPKAVARVWQWEDNAGFLPSMVPAGSAGRTLWTSQLRRKVIWSGY